MNIYIYTVCVCVFNEYIYIYIYMNEWMMHLYSALLSIVVHPKCFTIMWGGLSSTTTSVQHPLWWCDGCHRTTAPVRSPHTSSTGGEERESKSQSSGWGLLGGHDWQGPVEGIWPGPRDYTPTLYEKYHAIFNNHRVSGPRFNISSERQGIYITKDIYYANLTFNKIKITFYFGCD